ncbi:hypothetical protein E1100_19420 [Vibrio owensii]|uniref:hypothetical protein n=1 Tax=Vibrio owensii TaxID=696485 RepID=UPI001050E7D2|nr:hypothetical protein [Vibrio owensii]TDE21153.1 hypothetical protein E1100_19420 [Vibrio owensii]
MRVEKFIFHLFIILFSKSIYAFSVDSMIKISDENGNGVFTLTSTMSKPEYIKGEIDQIKIVDGKIEKKKLTKDNLPIWDLAILPTKVILYPGEMRRVALKNLCQKNCDKLEYDKVYQISFKPSSVDKDGNKSNVGINFGYAPYFIIPAEKPTIKYDYSIDGNVLNFNNESNTFLYVQLDGCIKDNYKENCRKTYTFLSGRIKSIELDSQFIGLKNLKIRIANHDYIYNEEIYVSTE